jgi:glutamate--cysteine ligase
VRLKRYLEMRGADGGQWRRLPSLAAYWVGLLYDDDSLTAAWDIVKDWTAAERQKLRDDVPKLGFAAEIRSRNILTLAQETLRLSARGLARRKFADRNGRDETRYLRPLEESVARGITPAEELLEKFNGVWGRSVDPIYDEYAY